MSTRDVHLPPIFAEKRGAAWGPVRVEHYRLRAGELPEHEHREHLLLLSMSGCSGEMRTAGGLRASGQTRGSVCLIPSGEPFSTRVGGDTECLGIYLDPALVERAARDADPLGRFEVVARSTPRDPLVNRVGMALLAEMDSGAPGSRLYAESLANVLAVHVLRNYTAAGAEPRSFKGGLSG